MKYIVFFLFLVSTLTYGSTDYIPPQAFKFKDPIIKELDTFFPTIPEYNYVPSLIEHESCITLKHRRCWNSASELRSSREQGIGYFQNLVSVWDI